MLDQVATRLAADVPALQKVVGPFDLAQIGPEGPAPAACVLPLFEPYASAILVGRTRARGQLRFGIQLYFRRDPAAAGSLAAQFEAVKDAVADTLTGAELTDASGRRWGPVVPEQGRLIEFSAGSLWWLITFAAGRQE